MSESISASELRRLSMEQLKEELEMFRREYQSLLQQKHSDSVGPTDIKTARKNVTRCTYVIKEKKLEALVEEFKGKKILPKELRPKLNKALRMKLTPKQTNQKVRRARIRAAKYPAKIFCYTN